MSSTTALDYISDDDDMIVPGTPEPGEEVKPFLIEQLPDEIIQNISVYWTIEEIQAMKRKNGSRILYKLLSIYAQQTHIRIQTPAHLFHYFAPTLKANWMWIKVQEVSFAFDSRSLQPLDEMEKHADSMGNWYLCSRRVPILRCQDNCLRDAVGYIQLEFCTEVYTKNAMIADVLDTLQGSGIVHKGAEKLETLTIDTKEVSSYGTQLPLTMNKELPSLRVLKLPKTTKFFLQEKKTLERWCPKLEKVEEARTTWEKIDGKWVAETEATEVQVVLSTKRKRLTLEEIQYGPGDVFRCSNCNGKQQKPYMAPEVALCSHCFTGTSKLVEMQQQIEKFKKQRKTCETCPKGAVVCKCEKVLALDEFMLTDYPVQ